MYCATFSIDNIFILIFSVSNNRLTSVFGRWIEMKRESKDGSEKCWKFHDWNRLCYNVYRMIRKVIKGNPVWEKIFLCKNLARIFQIFQDDAFFWFHWNNMNFPARCMQRLYIFVTTRQLTTTRIPWRSTVACGEFLLNPGVCKFWLRLPRSSWLLSRVSVWSWTPVCSHVPLSLWSCELCLSCC